MLFGDLFLSCNGARRALAGARVGVRPLAANRQTAAVPQSAITAEIDQAFDVHGHFAP